MIRANVIFFFFLLSLPLDSFVWFSLTTFFLSVLKLGNEGIFFFFLPPL